jgi:hypothetical protein
MSVVALTASQHGVFYRRSLPPAIPCYENMKASHRRRRSGSPYLSLPFSQPLSPWARGTPCDAWNRTSRRLESPRRPVFSAPIGKTHISTSLILLSRQTRPACDPTASFLFESRIYFSLRVPSICTEPLLLLFHGHVCMYYCFDMLYIGYRNFVS